jgi:hypothetical protein
MSQDAWFILFVIGLSGWISPRCGFFVLVLVTIGIMYQKAYS